MSQHYSNPERESDLHSLPDIQIFELTAREAAEQDEDMVYEYMKRHEFRLASMNSKIREKMFDVMIEQNGITGGWYWWSCFPGRLPDGPANGPFATHAKALADAQSAGRASRRWREALIPLCLIPVIFSAAAHVWRYL
jgi:hypothetical protein